MKKAELTIRIIKEEDVYVGQIEEFPAAISEGKTIEELKDNLIDALELLLDVQKEELSRNYGRKFTIRKLQFAG